MWYNTFFGQLPLPENLTAKKLARFENDQEFFITFGSLLNLVCSIFKWEGLPETCDSRALEAALLFRGCACVIPFEGGVTNAGAAPGGGFNVHGEYTTFCAYGWNGFNEQFNNFIPGAEISPDLKKGPGGHTMPSRETGVFIRDNYYLVPYINVLLNYSKRLVDTMRRIDTTSYNLVWPGIITASDGQVATVKSLIQQHDDNVPVVIGRDVLDNIGAQVISFGVQPQTLDALWDNYYKLYGRLMEFFGIDSDPTVGKAERVNTMEVSSNNVRIELARDNRLHAREKACEDMNKLFGLNVSVSYDETITEQAAQAAEDLRDAWNRTPGTGKGEEE